jgi:hypothetical protein
LTPYSLLCTAEADLLQIATPTGSYDQTAQFLLCSHSLNLLCSIFSANLRYILGPGNARKALYFSGYLRKVNYRTNAVAATA